MSSLPSPASSFNETLEGLLAEAARDGRESLIKLFWLLAPRIKTYAVMGGASNDEANNLVIETLLTLKREAIHFDPNHMAASTFLFRTMRNWRIAFGRKEFRPMSDPQDPSFAPDPTGEPGAAIFRKAAQELSTLASGFTAEQKSLLRNAFCLNRHHTAIGEEMSIPLAQLQQHIGDIVKKLQTFFREVA